MFPPECLHKFILFFSKQYKLFLLVFYIFIYNSFFLIRLSHCKFIAGYLKNIERMLGAIVNINLQFLSSFLQNVLYHKSLYFFTQFC